MRMNDCFDEGLVRKINPDMQRSKSLFSMAEVRIDLINKNPVEEDSASVIFTLMYDSLLEMAHAIAALKGYKILNHVCTVSFIEDLGMHDTAVKFDNYRKIRNSVNYYGKRLKMDFVKLSLEEMKRVYSRLKEDYTKLSA